MFEKNGDRDRDAEKKQCESAITVKRYPEPDTWNVINLQIYRFLRQSAKVDIKSLTFY